MAVPAKYGAVDYGWIEAEAAVSRHPHPGVLKVKRFWEKPSPQLAEDLFDRGCVWNTFVMIGRLQAFFEVIQSAVPDLYEAFEPLSKRDPMECTSTMNAIYEEIASADFSRLILSETRADRLGVFSLGDVGWTDLGDPRRVMTVLSQAVAKEKHSVRRPPAVLEAS